MMKKQKILVPIDFSDAAMNAGNYALSLGREMDATVILFHAYHIPVPTAEMPIMVISPGQLEMDNMQRLDQYRQELMKGNYKGSHIECIVRPGFASSEIPEIARSEKVDLIVMGISGPGKIIHSLLGSVATDIMREVKPPVLIIPERAVFKKPEKMVFACDSETETAQRVLVALRSFVSNFNSHLFVVSIRLSDKAPVIEGISGGSLLEDALRGISHSSYSLRSDNLVGALLEFEASHQADLLIMVPHKHNLLSRIFISSNTKEVVFTSQSPVLVLHE